MQSETMSGIWCPKILRKDRQLKALGTRRKMLVLISAKANLTQTEFYIGILSLKAQGLSLSLSKKYFLIFIGIVSTTAVPTILENERIDSCRHL